ncbi:unnamed protein product [Rangifer tarandus platyrhynchus]|uniref:Uncharacterized protein n=1 Tax=Rangifer tarandus platyrhynchus TaxID=3082113 RepID=A0AC59ZS04_RANTA
MAAPAGRWWRRSAWGHLWEGRPLGPPRAQRTCSGLHTPGATHRASLCVSEALVTPDMGARLEAGAPSAVGAPAEGQPPAPAPLVTPGSGTREGLQGLAVHT